MQQHIVAQPEQSQSISDRRVADLERTLVNRNETTERVLAACRRIQWQWNQIGGSK